MDRRAWWATVHEGHKASDMTQQLNSNKYIYIYKIKYYLAIKKNEIPPFAATWMDTENIMFSEISQTEQKQIPYYITYMWNLKKYYKRMYVQNKKNLRYRK